MKYKLIIDNEQEESIVITAHEKSNLILDIEKLINDNKLNLIGYFEDEIIQINPLEVYCFYTKNGKIYASMKDKDYQIKERIYKLEEALESFIKINQGCLVSKHKIKRFESSISGMINVVMKNGYSDYISRRELKNVKRRMGL